MAAQRGPALVRNARMGALHETFLVTAVATVLVIRTQLWLTHYPQLGGAGLHIAHLLWGGLFMALTIGLLLTYVGPSVRPIAAVSGGIGFGFFIDELGKFITADNNYFFRPAAGVIYLVFVAAFFLAREVQRRRALTPAERVANALDLLAASAVRPLPEHERQRALALLDARVDGDALTQGVRALVSAAATTPDRPPGRLARAQARTDALVARIVRMRAFPRVLAGVFALWAAVSVATVVALVADVGLGLGDAAPGFISDRLGDLSFLNVASVLSSLVSATLVARGLGRLYAGDGADAFRWFERALLVSILVTQTFSFVESQFGAVFGLGVALVLLVLVRRVLALETAVPPPAARAAARPVRLAGGVSG